jgi:hypothetical protein
MQAGIVGIADRPDCRQPVQRAADNRDPRLIVIVLRGGRGWEFRKEGSWPHLHC